MATRKPPRRPAKSPTPRRPDFIQTADKAAKAARDSFQFDLDRRLKDQARILSADDLSGLYDPKRGLFTTIDGIARPLNFNDLQAFRAAVYALRTRHQGRKYLGGIKPKQVIDLSRKEDRDRAQKEIHTAMPIASRAGVVHFQTNAGPNSNVSRHHVYVQFMDYDAAVASPVEPKKMAKQMFQGNIKFDCDCGRHTFWYRFIATIGGFNFGRSEDGFPRIRNPKLYGVACKHTLRVMALISQSPRFVDFAAGMIERGRKTLTPKRDIVKAKDIAKLQADFRAEGSRTRRIQTAEEKRLRRQSQPGYARQKERERARAAEKEKARVKKSASAARIAIERNARELLKLGAINQSQFDQMMAATNGS